MASCMKHLLFFALLLAISFQVHARESQFFSKTSRPEEPSTNYNYNPGPNKDNDAGFMDQSNGLPSTSFSTEFNDNTERKVNGDLPTSSSYTTSEFSENREQNVDNNPSSFSSEFPSRAFDQNQEYYYNVKNNVPEERGSYNRKQQYGMSDTRFLENGRYFYDVNAERNRGQYEPVNGNSNVGGFGSWHGANYRNNGAYGYNNEKDQGYQSNNQEEDQKRQDEYYDP